MRAEIDDHDRRLAPQDDDGINTVSQDALVRKLLVTSAGKLPQHFKSGRNQLTRLEREIKGWL